jgi:hypothetical protein
MRLGRQVLVLLLGLAWIPMARADQVADDLAKASTAWQAHDVEGTLTALDSAAAIVRKARADALKTLLPVAPAGWTADPPQTSAVSGELLGGGISASQTYHNAAQQVQVQITTDSPMLQNMAALLSSPYAKTAGVENVTIAGRSLSYTAGDNSFMTLVAGKVIVKVDGNKATPEATLRTFVTSIDFAAARELAH